MNVLITGGTGLIGKKLVSVLMKNTVNITVLTRDKKKAAIALGENITFIEKLSITSVEDQDIIINLAGEPIANKRWSKTQKDKICNSRWDITELLTKYINTAKKPPSLFISGSAIGIYGRQSINSIDESFKQYHQEFTHKVCEKWEQLALAAESDVTRVAILRTGIVLDTNEGALAKMLVPFKLGMGGKIGNGQQVMSWIHIDDVISAIQHIQKTETLNGVINLTAKHPVSNTLFSQKLASILQRPSYITTPTMLLRIIFGEMADLLLYGQDVLPRKLIRSGFQFKYPTLDKAMKHLLNQ